MRRLYSRRSGPELVTMVSGKILPPSGSLSKERLASPDWMLGMRVLAIVVRAMEERPRHTARMSS